MECVACAFRAALVQVGLPLEPFANDESGPPPAPLVKMPSNVVVESQAHHHQQDRDPDLLSQQLGTF